MNIALIGFRGVGKTTVSKLLTEKLGKKFVSVEDGIKNRTKLSRTTLVKKYGIERIQDVVSEIIEKMSNLDECVFDTSSRVALRNEDITNLKRSALIVLLTADATTIISRLKKNKRSEARGNIGKIKNFIEENGPKYKDAADYIIDTSSLSPEEICGLIIYYAQAEMNK